MSLAQHVTQAEGFDYERPTEQIGSTGNGEAIFGTLNPSNTESSSDEPQWRRLSFAPIETVRAEKPIAAYKVSNTRRWVQVATSIVACWLAAGIVFGFAALKPVLIAEGVYSDLCDANDPGAVDNGDYIPCTEQDLRLNLFFIAASVTANVSSLLAGSVLDRYGRRVCWIARKAGSMAILMRFFPKALALWRKHLKTSKLAKYRLRSIFFASKTPSEAPLGR
ncbi:FMP42 [Colletotrichum cuscutae]|uniref:FMP42 n=1 Tax=Colletotrichum cuscutae TaxID=1209917 RepID=A0AAI9U7J0_9PEZI|nr:FMP42 [Colletotrichum cuscutae]